MNVSFSTVNFYGVKSKIASQLNVSVVRDKEYFYQWLIKQMRKNYNYWNTPEEKQKEMKTIAGNLKIYLEKYMDKSEAEKLFTLLWNRAINEFAQAEKHIKSIPNFYNIREYSEKILRAAMKRDEFLAKNNKVNADGLDGRRKGYIIDLKNRIKANENNAYMRGFGDDYDFLFGK